MKKTHIDQQEIDLAITRAVNGIKQEKTTAQSQERTPLQKAVYKAAKVYVSFLKNRSATITLPPSRKNNLELIDTLLAGRAAEQIFLEDIFYHKEASEDLSNAKKLAEVVKRNSLAMDPFAEEEGLGENMLRERFAAVKKTLEASQDKIHSIAEAFVSGTRLTLADFEEIENGTYDFVVRNAPVLTSV